MRFWRRVIDPAPPSVMPAPPPQGLTAADRAELVETRERVESKWRAIDRLIADYQDLDRATGRLARQ